MKRNRRKQSPVSAGFTLLEVLVAFAILSGALTLIAAAFSRHLEVAQRISHSLAADELAMRRLGREAIRRHTRADPPPEEAVPSGYSVDTRVEPHTLEAEPVRGLEMDRAVARVDWSFRGRERAHEVTAWFAAQEEQP